MSTRAAAALLRSRFPGLPLAAALALLLTAACAGTPRAPAVRFDPTQCPEGTVSAEETLTTGPKLRKQWCERPGPAGEAVKHGPYVAWHPGGTKAVQGSYLDGKEHGHWSMWYPNGQLSEEGGYRDGKPHGRWTGWAEDGRKIMVMDFRDGEIICGEEPLQPDC